jgi:hypothetical protein
MPCVRRMPKRSTDRAPPILQRCLVRRKEACVRRKGAPRVAMSVRHGRQHRLADANSEFESWRQSLAHAFQLAEFIKDHKIARRYLVEYGLTDACDAGRVEMARIRTRRGVQVNPIRPTRRDIAQKARTASTIRQTMEFSDRSGDLCSRAAPIAYHCNKQALRRRAIIRQDGGDLSNSGRHRVLLYDLRNEHGPVPIFNQPETCTSGRAHMAHL